MVKLPITHVLKTKPEEFKKELLLVGKLEGNSLTIEQTTYNALFLKYNKNRPAGLGDVIEKTLSPAVKVIDKLLHTNVQGCGGCHNRKKWLNEHFPL